MGKTTAFGYFDPKIPIKAPAAPGPGITQPRQPTVSGDALAAAKAALTPYVKKSFAGPPRLELSPGVIPRAPDPHAPILSTPSSTWQGIQDTQLEPPSPDIAAGPNDVIMVVNSTIAQFDRNGNLQKLNTFQDFFGSVTGIDMVCPNGTSSCLIYDPWIRYDQLHGRFLFLATARNFSYRTSSLLLSVSNGASYDSGWKIWVLDARYDGTTPTANWADFWHLGFDNTAVYLAGNMFSQGGAFQYAKIRVVLKSDLYNPSTTTLPWQDIYNLKNADGTTASSPMPVHARGKPSAGTVALFVNASDTQPASYLTIWKIADPRAAIIAPATQFTISGLWPYSYPAPAPQLGGSGTLDAGDSRVLKAVYRNGFLYTARDAGYTDQTTTVTYDLIDTSSMKISSQARVVNSNSFYPAFDVPASTTPGTLFASTITGSTTAPDGSLIFAGMSGLKAGEGYFDLGAGGLNRWGDYFGGAVDPVSGGLWVSGEYAKQRPPQQIVGVWGTWAGYFPWSTAQVFDDVPSSSPYFNYINVMRMWQITAGCGTNIFCPAGPVTRAQLATFIIRCMFGDSFSYTTTPYFTDVPATDVFFPYIQKMRDLGITAGCGPNLFCPGSGVSRSDAAILIVRAKLGTLFGDNFTYPATPYFTDVPATDPRFAFVQKMRELGITAGCGADIYCPGSMLSREQVSVFLTRAFLN